MSHSFLVAPSILSADFAKLQKEVSEVIEAGADLIHVDVMDGHFVPNITIGPCVLKSLKSSKPLDVHLMIENPEKYIDSFIKSGADIITFHIEATKDPLAIIKQIKDQGVKVGISLRPKTDLKSILDLLEHIDVVLVMTVEPGFGGQSFLKDQLEKIEILFQKKKEHSFLIEVDGGVNLETAPLCHQADILVMGSYIFNNNDYKDRIKKIKDLKKV